MARYRTRSGHAGLDLDGNKRVWGPGEIVETNQDLTRHNQSGMTPKFELLEERPQAGLKELPPQVRDSSGGKDSTVMTASPSQQATAKPKVDNLDLLSVVELKKLADEEEIDLKGASKKEDMVRIIRQAK